MLELVQGLPKNVLAIKASGQVSGGDFRDAIAKFRAGSGETPQRLLYHFGSDFRKFSTTAIWDDKQVGLYHFNRFERVALVSNIDWIRNMFLRIDNVTTATIKVLDDAALDEALDWIAGK